MEIETLYLPNKVSIVYKEIVLALDTKSPILAGIGLRLLIETICIDNAVEGDNLLQKVDNLVSQKILTPAGSIILHKIRTLDDKTVHDIKPHNEKQLWLAMSVVEYLLNNVYILPAKMEAEFGK